MPIARRAKKLRNTPQLCCGWDAQFLGIFFICRKLGKRIDAQIDRSRKRLEKYEELALIIIVAVPIPGTGASIAALVSEMLKLDRKKAFLAISAGVIISAMLIFSGAEIFEMILGNALK